MTRMSKQGERRHQSPKKRHYKITKKQEKVSDKPFFKEHENALASTSSFIPKIR
jgi:hypothetical protein